MEGEQTKVHKRVLLIDSNLADLDSISQHLREKYSLSIANNISDALALIEAGAPFYFILVDLNMPGQPRKGIDLIRALRNKEYPFPLIATAETNNPEISALAIKEGASQFIKKDSLKFPCQPDSTLESVVEKIEKAVREFHEEYEKDKQRRIEAMLDPQTRLFNRYTFNTDLKEELARHSRAVYRKEGYTLSLLLIDINNLKEANDYLGHSYADKNIIDNLSQTLLNNLWRKDIDKGYRLTKGDEFAVLLPNTPLSGALQVAKRLADIYDSCRKSFNYEQYQQLDKNPDHTAEEFEKLRNKYGTLSIGATETPPTKTTAFEEFVTQADIAMYQAKDLAKKSDPPLNTVIYFRSGMSYPPRDLEQLTRKNTS